MVIFYAIFIKVWGTDVSIILYACHWTSGMRTVRGRGASTRPSWTRSWGGAHIVLYSDGLRTCPCRLDNLFRTGNIYFGAAIHILEPQCIFQSGNGFVRYSWHKDSLCSLFCNTLIAIIIRNLYLFV